MNDQITDNLVSRSQSDMSRVEQRPPQQPSELEAAVKEFD